VVSNWKEKGEGSQLCVLNRVGVSLLRLYIDVLSILLTDWYTSFKTHLCLGGQSQEVIQHEWN
jgi:hypothetical protein